MEEVDRRRLNRSRVRLVKELRLEPLWAPLLRRGLFTADMIEEIQSAGPRRDQARQLLNDLATRGRRALGEFVLCLRESGQEALAELLSDGRRPDGAPDQPPGQPRAHPPLPREGPSHQPRQPGPLEETPQRDSETVYPLNSEPCGYCLIINNVHFDKDTGLKLRQGSDIDCQRLEKRFQALHFEVLTKEDLTAQGIAQELQSLARRNHSGLDCCLVVILSHGCESYHIQIPGAIFGTDGQRIPVQKVVSYFNGSHCPSLGGKPKLFLIQACGGEEKDQGFEVEADTAPGRREGEALESDATPMPGPGGDSDELDATASLPTDSDILAMSPGVTPNADPGSSRLWMRSWPNLLTWRTCPACSRRWGTLLLPKLQGLTSRCRVTSTFSGKSFSSKHDNILAALLPHPWDLRHISAGVLGGGRGVLRC